MILCACGIDILLGIRNANKHLWCRCRGSNWLKISLNSLTKLTSLSPLILAGLPLLSVSLWFLQSSAGPDSIYHITSTQIQKNWVNCLTHSRPTRRNFLRIKVWQCQLQYPWLRWHCQFSAPSNSHIPTGLTNDQGTVGLEIKTRLVNMVLSP